MTGSTTSRRDFLKVASGAAAVTAASGSATAQEGGGGKPDYSGYLSDANVYDGTTADLRGQDEVVIDVGGGEGFAFDPPAVRIDPGTKIIWEWTGEGGGHNVVGNNADFRSGDPIDEEGHTYERTFEESQIVEYYCLPHRDIGMLGAIAVGDDIPTIQPDTGGGGPALPDDAKTLGIASGFAMVSTLGLAYFFMKYGGDYDEVEV
ncbi:MAG: halocyanin domain-containing protein [Halapricum sp.]